MISDNEPYAALETLDAHFPHSLKMGCTAAWTPFYTDRPFTLFMNGEIHADGMVGLARYSPDLPGARLGVSGLATMGPEYTITK